MKTCIVGHKRISSNLYGSQCIPCMKEYQQTEAYKAYRKQYKKSQQYKRSQAASRLKFNHSPRGTDYQREYRWKNLGLTLTLPQYKEMLIKQSNQCAICKRNRKEFNKNFSVDHDHNTGLVRGLLCGTCNRGIGFFQENTEILQNAINYLQGAFK